MRRLRVVKRAQNFVGKEYRRWSLRLSAIKMAMTKSALHPLRFEPIYQYRLWGGRRLADWFKVPLPSEGPIGEAWLLSDRDEHPSRVAEGRSKDVPSLN